MRTFAVRGAMTVMVAAALGGCGAESNADRRARLRDLEAGDVARVADERIDGATVRAIAEAQGTTLEVARERAIGDALLATEARARGRAPRATESAVLARSLLDLRRRELAGPVTDEELAEATRQHWLELDRPEGFRVVHAVVRVRAPTAGAQASNATWDAAEAVAVQLSESLAAAVQLARRAPSDDVAVTDELKRAAGTVDARGLEVRVEPLQAVAVDGRVLAEGGGNYVVELAVAVAKLRERGDLAAPFRTSFGVHVAILLERTPASALPTEERRALVRDETVEKRLASARTELLASLASTVELPPNAAALLDLVQVAPASSAPAQGNR